MTTTVTATPGSHELSYERVLQATPDLVYRAFTEAELVRRWWGGRYEVVVDTLEARPGGIWRYLSKDEDGTDFGFHGVFHDLVPGERIVQTFEFEGLPGQVCVQTLELTEQGGRTTLTSVTRFDTKEQRDGMADSDMADGARESYEALTAHLAKLA